MSARHSVRLLLLRALANVLPRQAIPSAKAKRILVLRPDHIGDFLFLLPALAELRAALPLACITLAVGPWVASLAHLCSDVDSIELIRFPGFDRQASPHLLAPYAHALQVASQWRHRFDAALVCRDDHWWGAMTCALSAIPLRYGWRTKETEPFLTSTEASPQGIHEVQRNLALVRRFVRDVKPATDIDTPTPVSHPLRLSLPDKAQEQAKEWLRRNMEGKSRFICVHPGAGSKNKLWPVARYEALVYELGRWFRGHILVTGVGSEAPQIERIAAVAKNGVPAPGEFSLPQLAAVLGQASLVIGSDSGPLHLAVAMGTPTVHIFGPADELRFGPWGPQDKHKVLTASVQCRPCGNLNECTAIDRLACMRGVTVAEVYEAARSLIELP